MADLERLRTRCEQLAEELADASLDLLREAVDGNEQAAALEKRVTRARRAVEKAAGLLGGGQVIAGWDQGVAGMKVGGRRRLTIPPDLGYGARGAAGAIKPNETLVFVVDLVSVR